MGKLKCQTCNSDNPRGAIFCCKCGAKIEQRSASESISPIPSKTGNDILDVLRQDTPEKRAKVDRMASTLSTKRKVQPASAPALRSKANEKFAPVGTRISLATLVVLVALVFASGLLLANRLLPTPTQVVATRPSPLLVELVSVETAMEIARVDRPPLKPEKGEFVIVTLAMANNTPDTIHFIPSSYDLNKGKQHFIPDPFASTELRNKEFFYCDPLEPDKTTLRTLAFDVPKDLHELELAIFYSANRNDKVTLTIK